MENIVDIIEGLLLEPPRKLVPILENGHSKRSSPYEVPDLSDYDFDENNMPYGSVATITAEHMSELDPRHTEGGAAEKMASHFKQEYQLLVQTLTNKYREPQITGTLRGHHWGLGIASEIDNLRIGDSTDFSLWIRGTYEKKNIFLVNTFDAGDSEFTAQIWAYCAFGQND
ncbi:hypothetical protein GCM10008090_01180 [Arenicella chitinivorans]|uniref:Uncharacterized protein n=1 Tax=Arenicella chitinivorans TaxID=1329800 RepID=A0A918RFF4_9GAMM|nr:hypothetical protein [Arenicella chitinivorans]GGZ96709.1 hypothetical protein GCM10008090_01180 [Arenicella chitinivorans]